MQDVRETRFVYFDDGNYESPEESTSSADMEPLYQEAFKKIEKMLADYLDVTPEIAHIQRNGCEMIVSLDNDLTQDFTMEHTLLILRKLEELFHVTYLEWDSEHDDWYDTDPHVLFGFYANE